MDTLVDLRNQGRTILFSTHRMDQVEKLCDNICLIHNGHVVLSGAMREIKSRYPANRVAINFEGDASFLNHSSIESAKNYSGRAEIKLRDGADPQTLLAAALTKARITRFEVMEPTLEEIFIEKVTAEYGEVNTGSTVDAA
jgi:ABC-2 type transport system ATP-binding protein